MEHDFSMKWKVVKLCLTQPTSQRRINIVSTLWINVEITLIWLWKGNKIRRRIFNVAQHWYNVSAHVETTLKQRYTTSKQRCTTLVQRSLDVTILNPIELVMIMDLQNMNSFYSSKWENIFHYILTIKLLRNLKNFSNSGTYRNTQWR